MRNTADKDYIPKVLPEYRPNFRKSRVKTRGGEHDEACAK